MKSKSSSILRIAVALVLTVLMLFSTVSSVIAAVVQPAILGAASGYAATGANADLAPTGGWEWDSTWKMGSNVSGGWDASGQSATHTTGSRYVTYDFYFTHNDTHSDGEVRFAFYQDGTWDSRVTPTSDATSIDGSSNKKNCDYGNSGGRGNWYWVYKPEWLNDDGKYYRVTMNLDMEDNNKDGKMWYTATALTSMSPTATINSAPTGGKVTKGTSINLAGSVTSGSNVGTVTYSYKYKLHTDISNTWIPITGSTLSTSDLNASVGDGLAYDIQITATDGGVTSTGTNSLSDRTETTTISNAFYLTLAVTNYNGITAVAKGTTDGTSYSENLGSIQSSTSVSSSTGLSVTAPDKPGYTFSKWVTSGSGTFDSDTSATTTFHPAADGEVATAQYKKIFTINSSVDNSGTGAGTVATNVDTVLAGGTYTITATAASGSAVESVTVNGTNEGTDSSTTINSVSANQTVVVKFKSDVKIGYRQFDGTSTWNEADMTVQSDGTYVYQFNNVAASRAGQFKAKVGTSWKDVDLNSTVFDDGATSCTLDSVDDGGVNYRINTTEAVNVKVIFNATDNKISNVIVDPVDDNTYAITVGSPADATLTATYRGTTYAEGQIINARAGQQITFSATTDESKYVNGYTLGEATVTSPYTVTASDNGKTLTCTVADKFTVIAKTNKAARGTVSVDKAYAVPNDTITITVSPKNGVLKSLTANYGNDEVYTCNIETKEWTKNAVSNASSAPAGTGANKLNLASVGANIALAASGTDQTYTMTLAENSSVTINAVFDTYSAESNWYYNGYDNNGNALSGYHAKQMTEGVVSGEKFSYYHVEGRAGTDQLMTVSEGKPASETRYVYFVRPNNYGTGWSASNNPKAYFWDNDNTAKGGAFPGTDMTWQWNNDYGQGVYKIAIPEGATKVAFNDASSSSNPKQTLDIDLTSTSGAYYVGEWNSTYSKYEVSEWDTGWSDQGWVESGDEYFYKDSTHNGDYTGDFKTKGFNNHNTASKEFAKPNDLGNSAGDYYINVLYPNKTYTINGETKTTSANPMIIWSAEPLGGDDENVTVYAKDGSIRSETYGSTYANIADTKIYAADATSTVGTKHSGNITDQTWETYKAAKGDTIVIKTQIGATDSGTLANAADLIAKYYVRGFCINGEVSELLEWNADGLYTLTYKIPEDDEDLKKIEITPIYYLKDTTANPIVTYRVTGFTDELKQVGSGKPNWGDTLYTYPFYGKLGSQNNALGAYPGQPMVYYKGQYQMQIPQKSTAWDIYSDDSALSGIAEDNKATAVAKTPVSGVTMSNGYYDIVHRQIMGYGDNGSSADHVQTYDYGDFYKIFNEKKPVDNIVFDFKYRTQKHNFENQPDATTTKSTLDTNYGTNGNGFELLTNFHGRTVDLFGTPLSGDAADPSKTTPVYVVSIGGVSGSAGVENIAGYYATEWMVYGSSDGSNYSRISAGDKNSIPPEVLVLNDDDDTSFDTTTYPSADANHNITNWKALYTALEAYRGKPVMISYEAADAQQGQGMYYTGTGGATRNDGRWLYSKNGENITSTIKIQYSENGTDYTDLNTTTPQVEGLEAYFTNADAYKKQTYATTIDPDKTFDFEAKTTNSDYMFVGWYMADGTKITSDNASHTERSGSYTFVAKFKKVTEGQLVLSHSVATGKIMTIDSADYTLDGSGTAKIGAVVKDHESGEILATYEPDTNDIILDKKYIGSEKDYDVEVTLVAKADENTALGTTELVEDATKGVLNDPFFNNPTTDESVYKQRTYTFSFNVKSDLYGGTTTQKTTSLIYHSYFIQYKFNYTLNYEYIDRNGQPKQMKRMGTLTSAEANTYIEKRGDTRYLLTSFIEKMAPYESNFGQDITWNFEDVAYGNGSNYTYSLDHHFVANQPNFNKRNITFVLPYKHNNGVAVMTTDGIGTKDTTTNLELIAVTDKDGKITQDNRVDFNTIPVLPNGGENGIFTEDGKKNWIAAPATIKDGNSVLNFQYWSVKPTDRAGENDPDVARCYFQGFNFVAYDNYIITPVYGASTVEPSDFGKNTNITYVETNRNQWNTNGTEYDYKTQKDKAADLLYNDFIVAYNYDGKDIFNGDADSEIAELGVVVERIQKLEIKDDGTYDTTLSRYTGIETHENEVDKVINGTSTEKNYTKHAIATNNLDNKNRIQFYNGVYNTAGWKQNTEGGTPTAYYTYKNYVYRAYSYMKLTNGTIIKSAVPAYFTMYDVATADSGDM